MERLDSDFLEKIILKSMIISKDFLVLISRVYEPQFFEDPTIRHIFEFSKQYVNDYNQVPSKEIIINSNNSIREDIKNMFDNIDALEFDITRNYEFLINQTNNYLKEKALKGAIIEAVDNVEDPEKRGIIRQQIEDALARDIKIDLGLDYFGQLRERLIRVFSTSDRRIPTGFIEFDEFINGGFPPYSLNILAAKIHAGKCVHGNTQITVKEKNKIYDISIKDIFSRFEKKTNNFMENSTMLPLEGMKKKYGEDEGTKKYNEWKNGISKSSKGRRFIK
jgi:replicative DNA helicase